MRAYSRQGHWRTNANGTTYWVSGHDVHREDFQLSRRDKRLFVNGREVRHDLCKHCYKKVFFYRNDFGSIVVFDRLGAGWPRHPCYQSGATGVDHTRKTIKKIEKPKPYDISALERRHAELFAKKKKRDRDRQLRRERQKAKKLARDEALKVAKAKQKLKVAEAKKKKIELKRGEAASLDFPKKSLKNGRRRKKGTAIKSDPGVERQPPCPRATTILSGFEAAEVGVSFGVLG